MPFIDLPRSWLEGSIIRLYLPPAGERAQQPGEARDDEILDDPKMGAVSDRKPISEEMAVAT